jgi:hypothetical protein
VGRREPGGREEVAKPRADEEKVEAAQRRRRWSGEGSAPGGGTVGVVGMRGGRCAMLLEHTIFLNAISFSLLPHHCCGQSNRPGDVLHFRIFLVKINKSI